MIIPFQILGISVWTLPSPGWTRNRIRNCSYEDRACTKLQTFYVRASSIRRSCQRLHCLTKGQVVPTQQPEALVGHGNGYGVGAGLFWLRRQSYSARFDEHTDRWETGRLAASCMQDVRQGILRTAKVIATTTVRGLSGVTHGNGAAAERRGEGQPLVPPGREPEQQGGVTDVSCSCSHAMLLACCRLCSIP